MKTMRGAVLLVATLAGCATVSVVPLDPTGVKRIDNATAGVRYYLPKPYLMVAVAPETTKPTVASRLQIDKAGNKTTTTTVGSDTASDDSKPTTAPTSSTTSFTLSTPTYMLKLIYLPDMTRPMALSAHAGLLGSASMKPTLQDGWMLTSLDGETESKLPDTISALASLVTAQKGGEAKAATKGGDGDDNKVSTAVDDQTMKAMRAMMASPTGVLRPGLYEFCFNVNGGFDKLAAVAYFDSNGVAAGQPGC